jgi:hypothetical protein
MTTASELQRIRSMLLRLTLSVPIMLISETVLEEIEQRSKTDPVLFSLHCELLNRLSAITQPEDHGIMAQAYEIYGEAEVYLALTSRGVKLERTSGTGEHRQKRPDFVYRHNTGVLYFEVKTLEIAKPYSRHREIAIAALDTAVDLEMRAKRSGVHSSALAVSGHEEGSSPAARIDSTIARLRNLIDKGQVGFGPTVLVVHLGRLPTTFFGACALVPVFYCKAPQQTCVSGELWHIALGNRGERIFKLPDFEGMSNLDDHQTYSGILIDHPELVGITFFQPNWAAAPELLTIWNTRRQAGDEQPCGLKEADLETTFLRYSDGLNDDLNERGWRHSVFP